MLALGQLRLGGGMRAHHRAGQAGADEGARGHRGVPGGADDLGRRGVLADEGRGAGLHRGEHLVVAGVHGQHDEADGRRCSADRADDVEAGAVGQLQVGDHDVGLQVVVARERLGDAAGLADDVDVGLALEGAGQTAAGSARGRRRAARMVVMRSTLSWSGRPSRR